MANVPRFDHATTRFAGKEGEFLLFVEADDASKCDVRWFTEHRSRILEALDEFGVVYFRGFDPDSREFEAIADQLTPTPMPLIGGVSPRRFVHGTVFTANDAPGPLPVAQHHEMAYHGHTPRYVYFYCDLPPRTGGATPISDGRVFGRTMEERFPKVMDDLEDKGVVFIRNYTEANFKSWTVAWQTEDRDELERKLEANDVEWEWLADDWLRTKQRRSAIVRDPVTNQRIIYATINIWNRAFAERVNRIYGLPMPGDELESLPFATVFGDGSVIPLEFINGMNELYDQQMVVIPYQARDFMVINNFLASHGKTPWTGEDRRVYVTMREPIHHSQLRSLPPRPR